MAVMQPERIARVVEYEWPPLLSDQTVLMDSYNSTSSLHSHTSGVIFDLMIERNPISRLCSMRAVLWLTLITQLIALAINF